jgi:hypothetical protein
VTVDGTDYTLVVIPTVLAFALLFLLCIIVGMLVARMFQARRIWRSHRLIIRELLFDDCRYTLAGDDQGRPVVGSDPSLPDTGCIAVHYGSKTYFVPTGTTVREFLERFVGIQWTGGEQIRVAHISGRGEDEPSPPPDADA